MTATKPRQAKKESGTSSSALCGKDPLLRFMMDKLRTPLRAAICAALIHGIAYFGAGLWVNHAYKGAKFTGIFDPVEIWWGSFLWLVVVPIFWAYFVWQPVGISKVIDSLHRNGVIFRPGEIEDSESTSPKPLTENRDLFSRVSAAHNRSFWPVMALLATSVAVFLYEVFLVPLSTLAEPVFWDVDPRTHSLLLVLVGFNTYIIVSFALRTLAMTIELRVFFRNRSSITTIHPLHPDECGGFGALGTFAARLGGIGIMTGFWAAFLAYYPMIAGYPPQLNLITAMLYVAYAVITPICLIMPIWSAHKAMQRFRDFQLSVISHEIEGLVASSVRRLDIMRQAPNVKPLQADVDQMGYLKQMYQFVMSTTPVWPISVPSIRRFSITASLPLVSGLLPLAIDITLQLVSG